VEVIRTIASVGSWILGSGTVSTDTFDFPCQVKALMVSCMPAAAGVIHEYSARLWEPGTA
jgi:hypothetical protein